MILGLVSVDISILGKDGIQELITIGIGKAAGMLNRMTNAHVHITVPDVEIIKTDTGNPIYPNLLDNVSLVTMEYSGDICGLINLIIPYASAVNLVDLLSGERVSTVEMDAARIETLMETGNILISTTMSALCTVLTSYPDYRLPLYRDGRKNVILIDLYQPAYEVTVLVRIRFEVHGRIIEGDIIFLLTIDSINNLISRIIEYAGGYYDTD